MNYYLHRLLFKSGFFKKVNYKLTTKINGKRFIIPVVYEAGYHNVIQTEIWLSSLCEDLLAAKKSAFIDVGMNIGQTLLKIAAIDSSVNYIGFEPNPLCYYCCSRLIEENNLKTFNVFPVGLSDKNDLLTLYMNKNYASGASVLKDFRKNMSSFNIHINVPVFIGDNISAIKECNEIAVIKADVEGAELEVIKGFSNTIQRTHPFIVLEILPVYNADSDNGIYRKKRQDELLGILKNFGYKIFLINEKEKQLLSVSEIEVHADMNRTNYFFVHENDNHLLSGFKNFAVE